MNFIYGLCAIVFLVLVGLVLSRRRLVVIKSPTLGFLNLKGESGGQFLAKDRTSLRPFFDSVVESTDLPPRCDVLFLYVDLNGAGRILGVEGGLREIIRDSGARIVVVASENSSESYVAAGRQNSEYGKANLVMTIARNGEKFDKFFQDLFEKMLKGLSMPVAWVKIAPQIPGMEHDTPATIFACELGQVVFKS